MLKSGVQLRDMRMRQARQHTNFAKKTPRKLSAVAVRAQQLQRLGALRNDVPHLVHFADAAMPKLVQHFVVADCLSRFQRHVARSRAIVASLFNRVFPTACLPILGNIRGERKRQIFFNTTAAERRFFL